MPIRPELRHLYPTSWREISVFVRFERAQGRCERCARPHLVVVPCVPGGRWFDVQDRTWRDARGRPAPWPDLVDRAKIKPTRVVLAAAHRAGNLRLMSPRNLICLCQRCHLLHDLEQHRMQRWITYRRRYALGDLFLGPYQRLTAAAPRPRLEASRGAPVPRQVLEVSQVLYLEREVAAALAPRQVSFMDSLAA